MKEYFPCINISRQDIEFKGYKASHLTDEKMQRFAYKLGDILLDGGDYWHGIEVVAESAEFNLQK
jgi:tellurite resistance-related uncharacterized protein